MELTKSYSFQLYCVEEENQYQVTLGMRSENLDKLFVALEKAKTSKIEI